MSSSESNKRAQASTSHSGDGSLAATPQVRARPKFKMTVSMPAEQYRAMRAEAQALSAPLDGSSPASSPNTPAASSSGSSPHVPAPSRKRKAGQSTPRSRARHNLSDGESDSEDPNILYRSLRKDEDPRKTGLLPPSGHNPSLSASQHITAGSRAKEKGPWISATRSKKVAAAWAAESGGQVVKFRKPGADQTTSFDMTNPDEARQVFPSMQGSSLNTAKASQEVVIKDKVPPENVLDVWTAQRVTVTEYNAVKAAPPPGMVAQVRSRTKVEKSPIPVLLFATQPSSASSLPAASSTNSSSSSSPSSGPRAPASGSSDMHD